MPSFVAAYLLLSNPLAPSFLCLELLIASPNQGTTSHHGLFFLCVVINRFVVLHRDYQFQAVCLCAASHNHSSPAFPNDILSTILNVSRPDPASIPTVHAPNAKAGWSICTPVQFHLSIDHSTQGHDGRQTTRPGISTAGVGPHSFAGEGGVAPQMLPACCS